MCHVPHLSKPHTSQHVHTVDNHFIVIVGTTVNNRLVQWGIVFLRTVRLPLR